MRRVSFVHQDLGLITELSALDNLALHGGFRTTRFGTIDARAQAAHTRALLDRFQIDVDVHTPLALVEPVERTLIAIAAALSSWDSGGGVLVLDEPTSALTERQIRRLFRRPRPAARRRGGHRPDLARPRRGPAASPTG